MAFYTIYVTPGLPHAARRQALKAGPSSVYSRAEQQALLRSAGFVGVEETDVTDEYLRIARAWLEANEKHTALVRQSEGEAEFAERQAERRLQIKAIEDGLLRRSLFVAEQTERVQQRGKRGRRPDPTPDLQQ